MLVGSANLPSGENKLDEQMLEIRNSLAYKKQTTDCQALPKDASHDAVKAISMPRLVNIQRFTQRALSQIQSHDV